MNGDNAADGVIGVLVMATFLVIGIWFEGRWDK